MDPMNDTPGAPEQSFTLRELQPWNEPDRVTENERLLGGLCYVSQILVPLLLPIIVLLTDEARKSLFVRYHAVHSLALLAVSFVYSLFALFGFLLLMLITGCLICVAWVLFLPPLVMMIYYGWQAFVGRAPVIPWVTETLQKYDLL
jgi:uncharacterized membrane protein